MSDKSKKILIILKSLFYKIHRPAGWIIGLKKYLPYILVSYRASACCLGKNNKNILTLTETITITTLLKQEGGRFSLSQMTKAELV